VVVLIFFLQGFEIGQGPLSGPALSVINGTGGGHAGRSNFADNCMLKRGEVNSYFLPAN
jgi:hypothetical protein